MLLNRKSVELLAPAGTWDALVAGVESGADAVYLGGKHFNMRMHEGEFNFDDALLKKAIDYAHEHGVRLYITLNNLISNEEIPALREYLAYLNEIRPDALLVQDFAVLELVHEMGITIPLHTSVMMNTHNEHAIEKLKEYGITRIVVGREMTLSELSLFRERTGIEVEYFMHGDMCISESGQCIHSGVLFGQSGNRGRCLKPCRWAYKLIDEKTGEVLDKDGPGAYKLALKDMCMYRAIPQLIQAGVFSFKIEGRMRPAGFIRRIVSTYRKAIDAYIADPNGYTTDEEGWKTLYDNRARDFTTTFAFGQPGKKDIGFTGEREPRFFSHAVKEAGFQDEVLRQERDIQKENAAHRTLSVRVNTMESAKAAIDNGADTIYVGGEAFRPLRPWKLGDYEEILAYAKGKARVVVTTPRTTMRRECGELEQFFTALREIRPDGLMVSNLGSLKLAQSLTDLPVQADLSFNLFNQLAAKFLKENGLSMAATSYELSFEQLREIVETAELPLETVVHGSYESMICDHDFPAMSLPEFNELDNPEVLDRHYALLDTAGEKHAIRIDQYGRNHLYFAKDLCLYPYLAKFNGLASYRIEAQDYTPELTGRVTKLYREALDALAAGKSAEEAFDHAAFEEVERLSPREWGIGTYRFRQSRNSI
ncbi:peptidase U32 family protein [Mitsuokella jalaludinii]|uniref:peptidase U32 family protein n=2 Tax=Mitsuokella jalaludinii TaxID=187979 RepID=UPI00259825BE|nr:U32 family peptidase [Mitsuokella jalaludinii]MCI7715903.1 U32 family peptidase [Mitsuokella jalaludinii]MDY5365381.1 U32 family peptidase [Mitsuokella jalaludinii]